MTVEQKSSHSKTVLIGLGVGAAVLVSYLAYESFCFVATDNAMIAAASTLLSSKVGGVVVDIQVQENEKVEKNQLLLQIKPEDYDNALKQAESERDSFAAQGVAAKAAYDRAMKLRAQGAETQEHLDLAVAQHHSLERKLQAAEAHVAQAKLNLDYTHITAPAKGQVGKKSFELGMLVAPGQPLLGFIAGQDRWVVANLKETDLAGIRVGQTASVRVDALPGRTFQGVLASLSPATGATFSLLPPDNATGNFTKVVQRVPVRINLLNLTPDDSDHLQVGLSADVKIRIR